ncbi:MAG TPA: 3-phosphoshikimate 1-carboxyvinyltransferase [Bacteroidia bacterium]|jgi:3-phosphoshikimate 1-carboxyvinyltransferase|nr:3-phosphoshikimate 1-carboxyvinyltransferase [Bacteroidia bacterium]
MIQIFPPKGNIKTTVELPGSKSVSNRLMMIRAISGLSIHFKNLSDSEDSILLAKALGQIQNKTAGTLNIHHAGTDMRFLTAYLSTREGEWIITGSNRMKQRPIAELVNALKQLGADISYLEKEGFPPLKIIGKKIYGGKVEIDASISSQFISALLLAAPKFQKGLELVLKGNMVSAPYVGMTISLLKQFGIYVSFTENNIVLSPSAFTVFTPQLLVESDWSAASYWYSMVALSENANVELKFLDKISLQADRILPGIYNNLGVNTEFIEKGVRLTKKKISDTEFRYDFTDCPDIAQTIAVTCFGLGIKANLTGLQTLKIKETDRISALKNEFEKFGAKVEATDNSIVIYPASKLINNNLQLITYNDHRMAMSFAPLALKFPGLKIEHPEVVEKSYPAFWDDMEEAGFDLK